MPPENIQLPPSQKVQDQDKTHPDFSDPTVITITVLLAIYLVILLLFHFTAIIYSIYLFTNRKKRASDELYDNAGSELSADSLQNSPYSQNSENLVNTDSLPTVTILKPLYGADTNLESRLESFFNLTYPKSKYKIYFCIQTEDDKAVPVCKKLQDKYSSKINSKLFIDYTPVGANPKINNMLNAWNEAVHNSSDFVWICDAGIHALPETLSDMVGRLISDENAAICHGLPFFKSKPKRAFGHLVEKTYFGTQHGRHYLTWNLLGMNCMNGQSTLIRLNHFRKAIGGLDILAKHLAEDFFMGKALDDAGYGLILSRFPALQDPEDSNSNIFKKYIKRMVRWTRLRMTMIPGVSLAEPFTECMISGLIISLVATGVLFPNNWWICLYIFLTHCSIWFTFDCILQFSMDTDFFKNDNIFTLFAAWWTREWATIYILLKSIFNLTSVNWGGVSFHVARGGETEQERDHDESLVDDRSDLEISADSSGSGDTQILLQHVEHS